MLVVACVAIIVVGPKDLPAMLRAVGKTVGNVKRMAGDFQRQFDNALKEAELDEVKNLAKGKGLDPLEDVKKSTREFQEHFNKQMAETKKGLNDAANGGASKKGSTEASDTKLPEPKAASTTETSPSPASSAKSATGKSSASAKGKPTASAKGKPVAGASPKKSRSKSVASGTTTSSPKAKRAKSAATAKNS